MAGEIDALAVVESSLSTDKPPDSIGMLRESSFTDFRMSACETHNGQEDHCNAERIDAISTLTDTLKDNEVENCIRSCSSRLFLETLDFTLGESLSYCNQVGEQRDDIIVSSPFDEGASGAVEEESDVTTEIKDETLDRKVCIEGNVHDLKESVLEIACNNLGSYQLKDNEVNDVARNSSPPGIPDNAPSFSGRSSWVHKSSHRAEPKRPSGKSKNKAKVLDLHIFMGERKRRTCPSKPARSSNWGFLGNIEKYFQHSNGLDCYEPSNGNLGQHGRKQNKSWASGSSQLSWEKKITSTSGIRLKVKIGNEVCKSINISEAYYTSAFSGLSDFETKSLAGISSEVPSIADGIEHKMHRNVMDKQLQSSDNKIRETKSKPDSSISDLHLAAKNLEGIGDAVGDCLDRPSHIQIEESETVFQKRYTDPGTSPDSEVIDLVPDCQVNTGSPESLSDTVLPSEVFASAVISKVERGKTKDIVSDTRIWADLEAGHDLLKSQYSNHLPPPKKSKGCQLPKKSCEASKRRSKVSGKTGNNSENDPRQKVKERKSVNGKKVNGKDDCGDNNCKTEEVDMKTGSCILDDVGNIVSASNTAVLEATNLDVATSFIAEQHKPVDGAWVRCDDCHKWRRIPVALADSIGHTNCQWICKDNTDKEFADCCFPQEKSNEDIDAELGILDADEDAYDAPSKSKGLECTRPGVISNEHEFTLISSNQFLHRSRKTQTIDEIMVCHCKLTLDGGLGCGDECLNRMLNIECVQGTCPCGDLCSNQQFQKRNYAKMKWERCGKKGYGLLSEEDISRGRFLIEYVGEVLDMHTYEARQRQYASNSHKHFYFMTLNGSEVIDACAKGNLARFINHSCDPTCRTEKWVVNGEICIGLFALRDIKKGEEVTFDYNYVRVVGAAAKKCYCGASNCRGYIGGDPTSTEVIDQVDSDEEFLEPVILEDGKPGHTFKNRKSRSGSLNDELRVAETKSNDKGSMDSPNVSEVKVEVVSEIQDAVDQCISDVSVMSPSNPSVESDDLKENFPSSCQAVEISETLSANHKVAIEENRRRETFPSEETVAKSKSRSSAIQEKRVFIKSRFLLKTSRESSSSKKGKIASNHLNASRPTVLANNSQMLSTMPKKFMHGTTDGRLETVEEKLNELLDDRGGISKRKDAARGYLKFLVHTAASGATGNGEAIQSNRDLSMILGALLKTKSRVVLVDIINKNGLRMLHYMIKQYRKDFKKTPILRKLLKVLDYLANKEILTLENINGRPPCHGMESFRDSMLSLTEHEDKQVHQIARNFRDKYIPRHRKRHINTDRDDRRMDFHKSSASSRTQNHTRDAAVGPAQAVNRTLQPKPATASMDSAVSHGCSEPQANGETKRRARVSRWDQPAPLKPSSTQSGIGKRTRESYCLDCAHNYGGQPEAGSNILSEFPPGFSPTIVSSTVTNLPEQNGRLKFSVGYQQRRFNSSFSVSYGIPVPITQKFGTPLDGTNGNWAVAPGMPFYPFPPLPPFPSHIKEKRSTPSEYRFPRDGSDTSTSGSNQLDMGTRVEDENQLFKRARPS